MPAPTPMNSGAGPSVTALPGTRRNVELALLIFAMLLALVYAGLVDRNAVGTLTPDFWLPVALLSIIFVGAHMAIRFLAPYADPALLPAVALVNSLGVLFLRRIDLGRAK